jgi:hypothetical protein
MKTIELIQKILELLGGSGLDAEQRLAALEAASVILKAEGIVLG